MDCPTFNLEFPAGEDVTLSITDKSGDVSGFSFRAEALDDADLTVLLRDYSDAIDKSPGAGLYKLKLPNADTLAWELKTILLVVWKVNAGAYAALMKARIKFGPRILTAVA